MYTNYDKASDKTVPSALVLVHGLWYRALGLRPLAKQLQRRGYPAYLFDYPSVHGRLHAHVDALRHFILSHASTPLHLVGHSLGGLVILRLLNEYAELPVQRVVLLGSPVRGSRVARRLQRQRWGRWLVGGSAELLSAGVRAPSQYVIGTIAGDRNIGLGRVFDHFDSGDGTVALNETELSGAADRVILPVSHTGMVFSKAVVQQIDHFLRWGRFEQTEAV